MDGEQFINSEVAELAALEHQGNKRVTTLLGKDTAFEYRGIIDPRAEHRISLYRIKYNGDFRLPDGLGKWSEPATSSETDDPWIEQPQVGQELALKIVYGPEAIQTERSSLLLSNKLFAPDDRVRPIRLYAFGKGETMYQDAEMLTDQEYLIEEALPEGTVAFSELNFETMTSQQRMQFVIDLAAFINKIHSAGMTHGDIDAIGLNEHVYYDAAVSQMRIIDFSHSQRKEVENDISTTVYLDRLGLATAITKALIDHSDGPIRLEAENIEKDCVGKFVYEDEDDLDGTQVSGQSMTAEGTQEIYKQLLSLQEKIPKS